MSIDTHHHSIEKRSPDPYYERDMTIARRIELELSQLNESSSDMRPPDFIIAGVKKAGTGQLMTALMRHTKIVR